MNTSNIKILMYHRLIESRDSKLQESHSVCVDDFRSQIELLLYYGYTPITFADYHLFLEEKLTLPRKPIIITFDDGYLDTYEKAIPILLEYDIRAVIFVVGNRKLDKACWDEGKVNEPGNLMSDEQIIEAKSLGFEIGAHTMNHLVLPELNDEEIRYEISGSKRSIERILNEKILSISYPYGRINDKVLRITEESGFAYGCGVYTGPPGFGENLHDLRRLAITNATGRIHFFLRLILPFQYIEWLYSRTKLSSYKSFNDVKDYFRLLTTTREG